MTCSRAPTVVEFIGGPLDGERRAMHDDVLWYKVPFPPQLADFVRDESKLPPLRVACYRRRLGNRLRFDYEGTDYGT